VLLLALPGALTSHFAHLTRRPPLSLSTQLFRNFWLYYGLYCKGSNAPFAAAAGRVAAVTPVMLSSVDSYRERDMLTRLQVGFNVGAGNGTR